MRSTRFVVIAGFVFAPLVTALPALAQGTVADYQRAMGLRDKYQGLAPNVAEPATWIEKTPRFWYRKSVKGGNEFVLVEAGTEQKRPAFDHEKLAAALTAALTPEPDRSSWWTRRARRTRGPRRRRPGRTGASGVRHQRCRREKIA